VLEKIVIFIVFLFPLIFFHELGHFIFARLFGVRVEVFSLGFGPKLFKFKMGDTEYCFSLIPLGGYVKMFGDDPLKMENIDEKEREYSFSFKNKWARFWIVFGGPLANFVFTYFIFFFLLLSGERVPEVKFGVVKKDTIIYSQGIRTGDVLNRVNTRLISNPTDIPIGKNLMIKTVTVLRNKQEKTLKLELSGKDFIDGLIKAAPILRKPLFVDMNGTIFDTANLDGSLLESSLDEVAEMSFLNFKLISRENKSVEKVLKFQSSSRVDFFKNLKSHGYAPLDIRVKSVNMDSAADKSGIRGGDVVLELSGKEITSFFDLKEILNKSSDDIIDLKIWSSGKIKHVKVTPDVTLEAGKKIKLLGVYSSGEWMALNFIDTKSKGLWGSFMLAFTRTWGAITKTASGFKKLITNEVSLKNIGGPIAIGKVATDSFNTSLSYFFQIMALISVNLGIINLFPIPVLDGGHIMFIFLEIVNRGPLSRRKMEIAQQFGLSLLLLLTFAALFNDFSRLF